VLPLQFFSPVLALNIAAPSSLKLGRFGSRIFLYTVKPDVAFTKQDIGVSIMMEKKIQLVHIFTKPRKRTNHLLPSIAEARIEN